MVKTMKENAQLIAVVILLAIVTFLLIDGYADKSGAKTESKANKVGSDAIKAIRHLQVIDQATNTSLTDAIIAAGELEYTLYTIESVNIPDVQVSSTVVSRPLNEWELAALTVTPETVATCSQYIVETADFPGWNSPECYGIQEDDNRLNDAYEVSARWLYDCLKQVADFGGVCSYGSLAQHENYKNRYPELNEVK